MPSNNYNYGLVSIEDNRRAKIAASPDAFGNFQLEDTFVVLKKENSYQWLRYVPASKKFERQDAYCLSCHSKRAETDFKFDRADYQKIKN